MFEGHSPLKVTSQCNAINKVWHYVTHPILTVPPLHNVPLLSGAPGHIRQARGPSPGAGGQPGDYYQLLSIINYQLLSIIINYYQLLSIIINYY